MLQLIVFAMLGIALIMAVISVLLIVEAGFANLTKWTQTENKCFTLASAASKMGLVIAICAMFIQISILQIS
jgi:hypothetical protein